MNKMIEAGARALCERDNVDPDGVNYDRTGSDLPNWMVVRADAKSVLGSLVRSTTYGLWHSYTFMEAQSKPSAAFTVLGIADTRSHNGQNADAHSHVSLVCGRDRAYLNTRAARVRHSAQRAF